jgi:hypothetical protein
VVGAEVERLLDQLAAAVAERVVATLAAEHPPTPRAEDEWRLVDETTAAGLLGRSPRWLRERRKRGTLSYVRLDGGRPMYRLEDLKAFAAAKLVPAATEVDGRHLRAVDDDERRS